MKAEDTGAVAVIGAGLMGHGIAQTFALSGVRVKLMDAIPQALPAALTKIVTNVRLMHENGMIPDEKVGLATKNITTTISLQEAVEEADFVIECASEKPKVKKELFRQIDRRCPRDAIIATNTSSISLAEITPAVRFPTRCVGMHWWNPPHLMPLVEVIKGKRTSESTVQSTVAIARRLGKFPVVCKDSPGFLGVRLQQSLVLESVRMLEEGLASAEDIDTAARLTLGLRLPISGPLRIVDLGGMDVFLAANEYLNSNLSERFRPPRLMKNLVEKGQLGVKSGRGFYAYSPNGAAAIQEERDKWLMRKIKELGQESPSQ